MWALIIYVQGKYVGIIIYVEVKLCGNYIYVEVKICEHYNLYVGIIIILYM